MNSSFTNLVDTFSKRFEPDGVDYLFRAKLTAPGIPVSAAERDHFVAEFKRASRLALWGIPGPTVVIAIGLGVALDTSNHKRAGRIALYVALAFGTVAYLAVNQWLFNTPTRALRDRTPTSPGRTKAEAQRIFYGRMTWVYIVGILIASGAVWLRLVPKHDLFVGWNRLWLAGLGVYILLFGRLAFRKWRSDRSG